jgi:hypothetical protein
MLAKNIIKLFIVFSIFYAFSLAYAETLLPIPSSKQRFTYFPSEIAVPSPNASHSRPVGVGSVATGGDELRVDININQFSASVDIYGAYIASYNPKKVHVLNPSMPGASTFKTFTLAQIQNAISTGIFPAAPWIANTTGPINKTLLDNIKTIDIPSGKYTAYLLITPAGNTDHWYLWTTEFMISNFNVTVEKFGEGSVLVYSMFSDKQVICNDNNYECSESYKQGDWVTLIASETGTEYKFHSWKGCDFVNNNYCKVQMNRDRTVFPSFARELVLVNTPIEINTQHLENWEWDTDEILLLYFNPQATDILNLKSGDIIYGTKDKFSFFQKVSEDPKLLSGKIVIETVEPDNELDAIIQEGTIIHSEKLTHADLLPVNELPKGVRLLKAESLDSTEFTIEFDNVNYRSLGEDFTYTEGDITLNGSITFELEPFFGLDLGFFVIKEFRTGVTVINENALDIIVKGGGGFEVKPYKLPEFFKFKPKLIACCIILSPKIDIYIGADGEVEVTLTTGVYLKNELTVGIDYKRNRDPRADFLWEFEQVKDFTKPNVLGSASVRGYIRPELVVGINGVAWPYFNLEPYLKSEIETELVLKRWLWALYLGLDANIGGRIKIFKKVLLEVDWALWPPGSLQWPLADNVEDFPDDNEPPSVPVINRVESYLGEGIGVYWDASTDNLLVSQYKIYRNGLYLDAETGTEFFDESVSPDTEYCYRITATDLSGNESLRSNEKCTIYKGFPPDFASCMDIRDANPTAQDGVYEISPNGQRFSVYCYDMSSNPREYLELVQTGLGYNFSQHTSGGAYLGTDVVTAYQKVRLDPETLLVDIGDQTFATSSGSLSHSGGGLITSMPYGVAACCRSSYDDCGIANIDLTDTPFSVSDNFNIGGYNASGSINFKNNRQVVDITGGGYCGWTTPDPYLYNPYNSTGGFRLDLNYISQ